MPDEVHGAEVDRFGGWFWRKPWRGEHFRTCSYCGSINPEDLAAESGWVARWADRKYGWPHKFYVDLVSRNPDLLYVVGATYAERPFSGIEGWIRAEDVPADVNTEGWRDFANTNRWALLGKRPTHQAKFYSVHLADADIERQAVDRIQAVSGLAFRFSDGRVSWVHAQ